MKNKMPAIKKVAKRSKIPKELYQVKIIIRSLAKIKYKIPKKRPTHIAATKALISIILNLKIL